MRGLRLLRLFLVLDAVRVDFVTLLISTARDVRISLCAGGILCRFMSGIGPWILQRWETGCAPMDRSGTMILF
jgi:hypothetical protein